MEFKVFSLCFLLRQAMSLLDELSSPAEWERFYEYRNTLAGIRDNRGLRQFIDGNRYLSTVEMIKAGREYPLPVRSVISKMGSDKKRVVYTYPEDFNMVLKLLTYLMLRKYDGIFSKGLYSFRPGRTGRDAVKMLLSRGGIAEMYSYKADIHDYFNSIPVESLLPLLKTVLADDETLHAFLSALLENPRVIDGDSVTTQRKGIMAGTPVSSFFANLYLTEMDEYFEGLGVPYARYSDDIIVFADTEEGAKRHAEYIRSFLKDRGLELNPKKEEFHTPEEGFTFLGFYAGGGVVDIAPATLTKLKQKMRRKRDALKRWQNRSEAEPERAAKAFIRMFNRKLLETPRGSELSWSRWFFPVINTDRSLREIDRYAQDCIRYLLTGRHTKARYNIRYEDIKALGYKNVVHEYYKE